MLFAVCGMSAQAPAPVKWRMTVKMTSPTEGKVTMKAILQPGWHLYGTELPQNGPKPTTFSFDGSAGVKFISELTPARKPLTVHDNMFDLDLTWWDADIAFTRTFKVTDADAAKIAVAISFMSCNNETCSPPSTEKFTKQVPKYVKK